MRLVLALALLSIACTRTHPVAPQSVPPPTHDVRWNELDCRAGWVELANVSDSDETLDGYALGDGKNVIMVLPHLTLPARGLAAADAPALYSACLVGRVELLAPDGAILDVMAPPPVADGSTWGRLPDGTGDVLGMPATRGLPNRAPPPSVPALNEVGCRGTIYLELAADPGADLSGSAVVVDGKRLDLPAGSVAGAEGLLRLDPGHNGFPFYLGCSGHTVVLLDRFGAEVDRLMLTGAAPGASLGRLPDRTGPFQDTRPTPGAPNVAWSDASDSLFGDGVAQVDITLDDTADAALSADFAGSAQATVTWTDDNGASPGAASVSINGSWYGTVRPLAAKAPFDVDFRSTDPGASLRGLPHLVLDNLLDDSSMLRRWLSSRILRKLGFPAPRAGYAWVRVNGEDRGLYLATEPADENMVARSFRDVTQIYRAVNNTDFGRDGDRKMGWVSGDPSDRSALTALVASLGSSAGFQAGVAPLVDEDEVLRAMAVAQIYGDYADYPQGASNYLLTVAPDGRMSIVDLPDTSAFATRTTPYDGSALLLTSCLRDHGCRPRYIEAVRRALADIDFPTLVTQYSAQRALLQPFIDKDTLKEHTADRMTENQDSIATFLAARVGDLQPDLDCEANPAADRDGDHNQCWFDCNERDPATNRDASEICGDGIDEDCDGLVDNGPDCDVCPLVKRGSHTYAFCRVSNSWTQARDRCDTLGLSMLVLADQGEADWVFTHAARYTGQSYWLGLTDRVKEGDYRWVDGTAVTFASWEQGEPNNYNNEDCIGAYNFDGHWNDFSCGSYLGVACEEACTPGTDLDGDGFDGCGVDCDDSDPKVHPGAAEICGDGIDQDCDGVPDNGCP